MKKSSVLKISIIICVICIVLSILSFVCPVKGEKSVSMNQSIDSKYNSNLIKKTDKVEIYFMHSDSYTTIKGVELMFDPYGIKMHSGKINYKIENKKNGEILYQGQVDCRRIAENKTVRFNFDISEYTEFDDLKLVCDFTDIPDDVELSLVCVDNHELETNWSLLNGQYIEGNFYCNLIYEGNTYPYIMDLLLILCLTSIGIIFVKEDVKKDEKNT